MNGLVDPAKLIRNMQAVLSEEEYIFATFPGAKYGDLTELAPLAYVMETEGLTLIIERSRAEAAEIPCVSLRPTFCTLRARPHLRVNES